MLTTITLTNYRAHAHTEITLGERMTLLLGGNQSGKSSVRLALEAALNGRNEMTNERGTGLRQQIRSGALEARIEVQDTTGGAHVLELPQGRRQGTVYGDQLVRACLRRGWFLGLPARDQRAFLQQDLRLAGTLSSEEWRSELDTWTPAFPDLGGWWLERFGPLDDCSREAVYDAAFAERATAKGLVKVWQQERAMPPKPQGVPDDEAEVRRIRDTQQQQLATLRAERATRDTTYAAELAAWKAEERRHEDAARRVADAQRRVETVAQAAIEANGKVGKGSKSITSLRKKAKDAEGTRDNAVVAHQQAQGRLETLASAEGVCPAGTCARLLMQAATRELRDAALAAANAQHTVEQTMSAIAECERRDREAEVLGRQSSEAEHAVQEALACQTALEPLPPAPSRMGDEGYETMLADAEKRLQHLDDTLARIEAVRREVTAWEIAQSTAARAQVELEHLQDELGRLNALVDAKTGAFTETGIIERRWRGDLLTFVSEVNALLQTFGLRVVIDDPWQIVVDTGDARIPVDQASQAEQTWVSAAFQVVIARRAGVPIVALDEMGNLDGSRRRAFYGWALALEGVQVLLIAAAQDTARGQLVRPTPTATPGLQVYWLEGGRAISAEKIQEVAAA